jgi:hypothetical protein
VMKLLQDAKDKSSIHIGRLYTLFMIALAWDAEERPSAQEMLDELESIKRELEGEGDLNSHLAEGPKNKKQKMSDS